MLKTIWTFMVFLLAVTTMSAQEIMDAAKNGNLAKVKELVENDPLLVNAKGEAGRTPLHWAARGVHAEVLSYLVGKGAQVDARDARGVTALHSVCSRGHAAAARLLLDRGANVAAATTSQSTPLHLAAGGGWVELVLLLLDRGAPLDCRDAAEDTPLHAAAHAGKWEVAEAIANRLSAQKAAVLDLADFDGHTLLHLASQAGRIDAVKAIASRRAELNARNALGQTACNLAAQEGYREIADFLARQGAAAGPQTFPRLAGPYLGQKPPDDTPQLFAKGIVSRRIGMYGTIVFAPDGRGAFWKPELPKLMSMKMEGEAWSAPAEAPIKASGAINVPFYSLDGKRLYFMVGNEMGQEKESIWFATRSGDGWSDAQPFDATVNSRPMHWQFSLDRSGDVYFSANKIFCARFVGGRYSPPEPLPPPVNRSLEGKDPFTAGDFGPCISASGDFLIFTRMDAGAPSPFKLFISFRNGDGTWAEPQSLSARLRSEGNDSAARISPDGKYLFFQSVRRGSGVSRGLYWVSAAVIDTLRPKEMK